jgi:hypothetical protein
MPSWNFQGRELELFHLDATINERGVAVDLAFAQAAIEAAERAQAGLAEQTVEITDGAVGSATQRDALLAHILQEYGVTCRTCRPARWSGASRTRACRRPCASCWPSACRPVATARASTAR